MNDTEISLRLKDLKAEWFWANCARVGILDAIAIAKGRGTREFLQNRLEAVKAEIAGFESEIEGLESEIAGLHQEQRANA